MSTSPSSTSPSSAPPPPAVRRLSTDTQQRQPKQPIIFRHPSFDAATQQVLFQAYLHALRTGQAPMPNISPQGIVTQAQKQANHGKTISDAKRGVTYAGQTQLKKLPIPTLEETCKHYLESVKPFLVCTVAWPGRLIGLDTSGVCRYEECCAGFPGSGRAGAAKEVAQVCRRQGKLHRTVL
jgi:hypothetical protein